MRKVNFKITLFLLAISLTSAGLILARQTPTQNQPATSPTDANATANDAAVNQMIDRIVGREAALTAKMKNMHPLVETYLQTLDKDDQLTFRPVGDQYFLGKLDFKVDNKQMSMLDRESVGKNLLGRISQLYSVKYLPGGFIQMLVVGGSFDRKTHDWEFVA